MKRLLLTVTVLSLVLTLSLGLASCDLIKGTGGNTEPTCQHRDADDDLYCDHCGESYEDGKDVEDEPTCQHRDADDNSLCDKCGESYTDGKDVEDEPACQHRDADDNSFCDKCGESYTDGKDVEDEPACQHRDADDNSLCDKCGESYTDGKDVEDEPTCQHRDEDDDLYCDHCGESYEDGKDVEDEPTCEHRDEDDNALCDYCFEKFFDGVDMPDKENCEHYLTDWSVYIEPTCGAAGQNVRRCELCYLVELEDIEPIPHDFTVVEESYDAEGNSFVSLFCSMCGEAAGNTYKGHYMGESGMYLVDCPTDFTFDIRCESGIEYLNEKIVILELSLLEIGMYDYPELREEFVITELGADSFRISAKTPYSENKTYCVILSEDAFFADIFGQSFMFSTVGDEVYNVTVNSDILFLKAIAEQKGIDFIYSCEYVESEEYGEGYVLQLPVGYGIDSSYIGRLLCIGDCVSFDEAEGLFSDEVMIGKIAYVQAEDNILYVLLTVPSIDEIYDEIDIHGGRIPEIDESVIDEESREIMKLRLMRSNDFIAAISAANIAAMNFAADNGYYADVTTEEFKADDFDIKVVAKTAENGAIITVTITYTHTVPISEGDIPLGHVTFKIEFVNEYEINIDVNSNLDKIFTDEIKKNGLNLDCTVVNTIRSTFDIDVSLEMSYSTYDEAGFVINLDTGKIHRISCRHCPGILDENYIVVSYADIPLYVDDMKKGECKVCQPFSLDDSAFAINNDSGMIHCINCMYLSEDLPSNYYVIKAYPVGYTGSNCTACRPEEHIKSLEEYLDESVCDGCYYEMFDTVRKMLGDKTTTGQASAIDDDTKPRITIGLYCFEIPIFVEPEVDFNLKADFSLHYELTVKNTIFVGLIRTQDGYRIVGSCDVSIPKDDIFVDITGSIRAEVGILSEMRLGVRYIARHVYIGISGSAGMYVDVKGVYHLDSAAAEQYYAARFEVGYYTEVRCTYKIIGILRADSFAILDKEYTPIFNSGDDKIYTRFDSYEDSITVNNIKRYYLDNRLLKVTYFDLLAMENKSGYLSWGEKKQYGFECVFTDESGAVVDYIIFEGGAIVILDSAPDEFTVYMEVTVYDKVIPATLIEYIGKDNKGGCAVFLDSKTVKIDYSYTDTTDEMQRWLGIYEGYYDTGEDFVGNTTYRYSIMGLHRITDLYEDEETLAFYAHLATYVELDDFGNPKTVYTVEKLRELLLAMPYEYVFVNYSKPGNGTFDFVVGMSAQGAYYTGEGIALNSVNDYYLVSENAGYVNMTVEDYEIGVGFSGSVYNDTGDVYIGRFVYSRTELPKN